MIILGYIFSDRKRMKGSQEIMIFIKKINKILVLKDYDLA